MMASCISTALEMTYARARGKTGKIDILWFDGGGDDWLAFGGLEYWGGKWHSRDPKQHYAGKPLWEPEKLYRMIRQLQPKIVMNDRAGSPGVDWGGDFHTPERKIGQFDTERPWETCDVLAESWGYVPNEPIRSLRNCIQLLVQAAVNDGNLLLNVGPKPDGAIEERYIRRLKEVGAWLRRYGESIYLTRACVQGNPNSCARATAHAQWAFTSGRGG